MHLPCKHPAVSIRFSPIFYRLRQPDGRVLDLAGLARLIWLISFLLHAAKKKLTSLPYRMVFAVATTQQYVFSCLHGLPCLILIAHCYLVTRVLLYDTEQLCPFAVLANLHYAAITDLSWYSSVDMPRAADDESIMLIV